MPNVERAAMERTRGARMTRDEVLEVLTHPDDHEWQVQGFGMLRTYLDGPGEPRLQVWDQRLATWSNNAIHDHPWAFESTIFAGIIYNQRYAVATSEFFSNGQVTEIIPGTRGGKLTERPVVACRIEPKPVEVYAMGDRYSQRHREMHLTRYLQGTVTLIERSEREAEDIAHVAWFGNVDEQPPFVNPYPPTAEQVARTLDMALTTWFR